MRTKISEATQDNRSEKAVKKQAPDVIKST